jgi:glucose-1-phosphate adenylyltransferase
MAPPARFRSTPQTTGAGVVGSMVSAGSAILGGSVRRSVLSPLVTVREGAAVEECILMHGATVGRGARLRRTIVDKYVEIPDNAVIGFDLKADERQFRVTERGIVVVERKRFIDPFAMVSGK